MSPYQLVAGSHNEVDNATEDGHRDVAIGLPTRGISASTEQRIPLRGATNAATNEAFHRLSLDEPSDSETLWGVGSLAAPTRPSRGIDPPPRQPGDEPGGILETSPKERVPAVSPIPKRKRIMAQVPNVQNSWLLEYTALFICLLAFGAVVVLLARFDNKLVSEWKEKRISINTAISILAGISRGSLALAVSACIAQSKWNWFTKFEEPLIDFDRFDAASRGPWGACRLVGTLLRRPHWIFLGALSTITLVGYEPFLQALISFDYKPFVETTNGTWTRLNERSSTYSSANMYSSSAAALGSSRGLDVGSLLEIYGGTIHKPFNDTNDKQVDMSYSLQELTVDFGMTAAIWNGFSDLFNASSLQPNFLCSTGNCTWDEFATLAVCSECQDISRYLLKKSGSTQVPNARSLAGWPNNTIPPDVSNPGKVGVFSDIKRVGTHKVGITKYVIPQSGLNLSNYNGAIQCRSDAEDCSDTYMSAKVITNPGRTILFQNLQTMILAVQTIEPGSSWKDNKTLWENTDVKARECSLHFCVNAYQSRVEQGLLRESLLSSWSNRTANSFSSNSMIDKGYNEYANFTLDYTKGLRLPDLQLNVPKNANTDSYSFKGKTFNISQSTVVGMFQVFVNGFGNQTQRGEYIAFDEFPNLIYPFRGGPGVPSFMISLSESADVGRTFQNLASSLSKWMRDREFSRSPLSGHVMQTMLVTRVRWPFLILPFSTLLMGAMFVGLSIYQTHRMNLPAWKTDSLVSLVHGSSEELYKDLEAAAVLDKLYETAQITKVSMIDAGGLRKLGINDGR